MQSDEACSNIKPYQSDFGRQPDANPDKMVF